MTNILDNEKVQKYFQCEGDFRDEVALAVLTAMQQPIKRGERLLEFGNDGYLAEVTAGHDDTNCAFHPFQLRLPDRFQNKECEHPYGALYDTFPLRCTLCESTLELPKPAPEPVSVVEEKLLELSGRWSVPPYGAVMQELRALVEMAREGK